MTTETNPFDGAEFAPDSRPTFATAEDAYRSLPDDVVWSCSFGYPGQGGFRDHYRTPAGVQYVVSNGAWDDFEPRVWTVERID